MSATASPTKQSRSRFGSANSLVPFDRPSSAGDVGKLKKGKKESPKILGKLGGFIKNRKTKNKEEGIVHARPRCFVSPPSDRHSESPEPSAVARSTSLGNKHPFKVSKKNPEMGGPMWSHKVGTALLALLILPQ